ncbi:Uncharacterised protein [Serratia entomophila]|uniref:hypothetical protein n=1 Tax=Serratia entomophila TaxID=42906 RepID=UPI002179AE7B|nr:hypothetical protein [Serratia entomophila]CAI2158784.1 Uncharacterised protein [Serratia entomophila]
MTEVLTYEALKAERDAQQKRADALAVRNEQLMAFVTEGFNIAGQGGTWCGGDLQELGEKLGLFAMETYQPVLHGYICGHEPGEDSVYVITKSPTDAALAAVRAQAVDEFSDSQMQKSLERRAFGNAELADVYNDNAMDAKAFAMRIRESDELREGK